MKTTVLFLSLGVALSALAQEDKLQPCMEIKKACEEAGFQSGLRKVKANEGKGSVKECMQKISNREKIPGINLSEAVIKGCTEKHEK